MPHPFNDYYASAVLDDSRSDFLSWAVRSRKLYTAGPLLDLGVADAFMPPPDSLAHALQNVGNAPADHGYSYQHGDFEQACGEWLARQYPGFSIDGLCVIPTAGAKGALNLLALAFINPGDLVLTTSPGYPIFTLQAKRLGARVVELPLLEENGFVPDARALDSDELRGAKLMLINSPNNPTGSVMDAAQLAHLQSACLRNGTLLINDAAYGSVIFDAARRATLLGAPAAKEHCFEVHSLSKSLQIPGWRLGFLVCPQGFAPSLRKLGLLLASGQPRFLQQAAAGALREGTFTPVLAQTVSRRIHRLAHVLRSHGFRAEAPQGTFFLYAAAPTSARVRAAQTAIEFSSALECAEFLARTLGIVTVPWDVHGSAFLRFSAAFPDSDEERFHDALDARLGQLSLEFTRDQDSSARTSRAICS